MPVNIQQKVTGEQQTVTTVDKTKVVENYLATVLSADEVSSAVAAYTQKRELSAKVRKLQQQLDVFESQVNDVFDANGIKVGDEGSFSVHGHTITCQPGRATTEIDKKEDLYNKLEGIEPGLFFELCSLPIGTIKKHLGATGGGTLKTSIKKHSIKAV
jgi:hypothetical protein